MSENPLKQCPSCDKEELQRLIGGGLGIIFKGSGFYVNDARGAASEPTDASNATKSYSKSDKGSIKEKDQTSNSNASVDKKATA